MSYTHEAKAVGNVYWKDAIAQGLVVTLEGNTYYASQGDGTRNVVFWHGTEAPKPQQSLDKYMSRQDSFCPA